MLFDNLPVIYTIALVPWWWRWYYDLDWVLVAQLFLVVLILHKIELMMNFKIRVGHMWCQSIWVLWYSSCKVPLVILVLVSHILFYIDSFLILYLSTNCSIDILQKLYYGNIPTYLSLKIKIFSLLVIYYMAYILNYYSI